LEEVTIGRSRRREVARWRVWVGGREEDEEAEGRMGRREIIEMQVNTENEQQGKREDDSPSAKHSVEKGRRVGGW
jgi:hypothetical protein